MWESDSTDKYEQYYIDYRALLRLLKDSDRSNSAERAAGVCSLPLRLRAKVSIDTETTVYSVK